MSLRPRRHGTLSHPVHQPPPFLLTHVSTVGPIVARHPCQRRPLSVLSLFNALVRPVCSRPLFFFSPGTVLPPYVLWKRISFHCSLRCFAQTPSRALSLLTFPPRPPIVAASPSSFPFLSSCPFFPPPFLCLLAFSSAESLREPPGAVATSA